MELYKLIAPLRRWWWVLLATTMIAAFSSYISLSRQPPVYQSRTTLMIGRAIEDPNPTGNEFTLTYALAEAYADMAMRDPIRNSTMEVLGLNSLPEYQVRAIPRTQLVEITVVDTHPVRAQAVASELANQLILRSPTSNQPGEQDRQAFINQQLDALEIQIKETQDRIASLQEELGRMISAQQLTDTQNQITALQTKVNALSTTYASMLANTQQGAINTLSVVEPAELPRSPLDTNKGIIVLIATGIGFILAAGVIYIVEYFDDTLRTIEDFNQILQTPVIGSIREFPENENAFTYVADQPRSLVADDFRLLRSNLEFAAVSKPIKTIMISSPEVSDGKSTVATNLALSIAQTEKKVILIDGDLRKPSLNGLGIPNQYGLSDVFRNRLDLQEAMFSLEGKGVSIILSGVLPPNPTELLGSAKMDQILSELKELFDVVIIDASPFFIADAVNLAAKVDGILVIVRPGSSHRGPVTSMKEQIQRTGVNVLGVVLNQVPLSLKGYGSYHYSSSYSTDESTATSSLFDRLNLKKIFDLRKIWMKPSSREKT